VAVSYELALGILLALIVLALPWAVTGLQTSLGRSTGKPVTLRDAFKMNYNINVLSLARVFLFGSRYAAMCFGSSRAGLLQVVCCAVQACDFGLLRSLMRYPRDDCRPMDVQGCLVRSAPSILSARTWFWPGLVEVCDRSVSVPLVNEHARCAQ
jgi:hypothetical protein